MNQNNNADTKNTRLTVRDSQQGVMMRPKTSQALQSIDEKLARVNDQRDLVLLTQVRGEIIRQDNSHEDEGQKRSLQKIQLYYKFAIAPVSIATGVGLLVGGFSTAGLFVMGAGLAAFAPNYVGQVLKLWKRGDNNEN